MLEVNRVYCMDYLDLLGQLEAQSVDAIITDPPYGMNHDTWDKSINVNLFLEQAWQVMKPDSFLAFTHLMPYALQWLNALQESKFLWVEHVVIAKRNYGSYGAGLSRTHESLFIYRKGKAKFVQTKGRFSDVKAPGLLYDTTAAEGLQRYIDALWARVHGKPNKRIFSSRRHAVYTRRGGYRASERDPEDCNFSNLWSFLPEQLSTHNQELLHGHATVKSLKMVKRLVELLTEPNALIVDCFMGSGTTLRAAQELGRRYIGGDITPEYVTIANKRLAMPYNVPLPGME